MFFLPHFQVSGNCRIMPASPVKWSAFAGPEVEQVFGLPYGTKRKTDDEAANLNECTTDGIQVRYKVQFVMFLCAQLQTPDRAL